MSELADRERIRKQHWAAPGGSHDEVVRTLKIALPVLIGVLMAFLAMAPLSKNQEISFILDKQKVDVAKERMRVQEARYRGQDDKGRPFMITARSAVQATSRDPIVDILGMRARIALESGPATLKADRGRYNLETETVNVIGPILFTAADGYRLQTRDVAVDLDSRVMATDGRVEGQMPLGRFSANRMRADLESRTVTLTGNARLHIVQGGLR
ncbi:LPS export ABC transporter periplasmic protein LptC [Sphingosinicella humi]|uniref:LPS export ABC transporter periplasmic protein LptC n=1 Tax=Allosphingosinicella humi TaxID=2068657 RepID=A0A2U2J3I1_9SPHN|nr:LPS export ABC transporter periplasmic protein LptC [Sphingosinicella humi]PWG02890.1 LPS export ABC transporter periplasmic protein LptC [Sphingosinicella humi]